VTGGEKVEAHGHEIGKIRRRSQGSGSGGRAGRKKSLYGLQVGKKTGEDTSDKERKRTSRQYT